MEEFVKEKDQLDKIKQFQGIVSSGDIDLALIGISFALHHNIETMKNITIDNKKIIEYDIYKTHCHLFEDISRKTINRHDLLSVFGLSENEINELKEKKPDKKQVSEILFNRFGVVLNEKLMKKDIVIKETDILQNLTERITPQVNKKIVESMSFSNVELNRILNGITDYLNIDIQNKSAENKELKQYLSLKLYSDAFEIYLKVLKEIYSKHTKIKIKDIDNRKLYDFFDKKYSLLLDSTNNKLRNDVCHLNYTERSKYTIEQIDEERRTILVKALTGIIARNIFIVDFYDEFAGIEDREEKHHDEILKLVSDVIKNVDNIK